MLQKDKPLACHQVWALEDDREPIYDKPNAYQIVQYPGENQDYNAEDNCYYPYYHWWYNKTEHEHTLLSEIVNALRPTRTEILLLVYNSQHAPYDKKDTNNEVKR